MFYSYKESIFTANNNQQIKPLKWNSNIRVQFEFKLERHERFHTTLLRFCSRFLTTVKMTHNVEIDKFDSFLGQIFIQKNLCRCCNCLGRLLTRVSIKHRGRELNLFLFLDKLHLFRWANLVQVSPYQYTTKATAFLVRRLNSDGEVPEIIFHKGSHCTAFNDGFFLYLVLRYFPVFIRRGLDLVD